MVIIKKIYSCVVLKYIYYYKNKIILISVEYIDSKHTPAIWFLNKIYIVSIKCIVIKGTVYLKKNTIIFFITTHTTTFYTTI